MKYNKHIDSIIRKFNAFEVTDKIRMHVGERTENFDADFFNHFLSTLTQKDFLEYPDATNLRKTLAQKHQVEPENVFLAPGSDYALAALFYAFVEENTQVLMPEVRFPMYDVYLAQCKGQLRQMNYELVNHKLSLNIDAVFQKDTRDIRLVVVGNPNSPVGDILSSDEFAKLEQIGCPIVVDQAYAEFGKTDLSIALIEKNYVFVNTFSKAFGAAGIRVGYAIANARIVNLLDKFRLMYEMTGPSVKFAMHLLNHEHQMEEYVDAIIRERNKLSNTGIQVQHGNWIHLPEDKAAKLSKYTFRTGVTLPCIDQKLIRINLFRGLYDIINDIR